MNFNILKPCNFLYKNVISKEMQVLSIKKIFSKMKCKFEITI